MKRLFVMMALVLAAAALLPMSAAYAAPPTYVHGTYVLISTQVLDMRQADGNTFIFYRFEQALSGDTAGTAITFQHTTVHSDGSINWRAVSTCDNCTLFGEPMAPYEQRLEGTGHIDRGLIGTWHIVGGLYQGHGTINNVYGGTATYEGWVQMP